MKYISIFIISIIFIIFLMIMQMLYLHVNKKEGINEITIKQAVSIALDDSGLKKQDVGVSVNSNDKEFVIRIFNTNASDIIIYLIDSKDGRILYKRNHKTSTPSENI